MEQLLLIGMWHYIVPPEGLPVNITGELCSLENFRKQLQTIKERFTVLSPTDIISNVKNNENLPEKSIILTFDDGTKDHYKTVLPVLQEMDLTATFFILGAPLMGKIPATFKLQLIFGTTDSKVVRNEIFPQALRNNNLGGYLENIQSGTYYFEPQEIGEVKWTCNVTMEPKEKDLVVNEMFEAVLMGKEPELIKKMFLTKTEVLALQKAGMTIGSHGVNHHTLSTLDDTDLEKELVDSKRILQEVLGSEVSCLGYPGCQPPEDINKVKSTGYSTAFACNINPPVNRPPYDFFALRRIHEKNLEKDFLS